MQENVSHRHARTHAKCTQARTCLNTHARTHKHTATTVGNSVLELPDQEERTYRYTRIRTPTHLTLRLLDQEERTYRYTRTRTPTHLTLRLPDQEEGVADVLVGRTVVVRRGGVHVVGHSVDKLHRDALKNRHRQTQKQT